MEPPLKPFAASATGLRLSLFLKTRLRLTALYVLIVTVIVGVFSIFLFTSIVKNLRDASEDDFLNPAARMHFIEHTVRPIRTSLLLTDLIIILGTAGLSYWLAGKTLEPVRRSLEAQRLFAAQASHELRTPLAVIRNDAEVTLRNSHATPQQLRSTLESSIEEVQGMTNLVENLLALARSEHTATSPSTRVALAPLQEEVIGRLRIVAEKKAVTLSSTVQGSPVVTGETQSLERVLVNLLQNSIEHTPEGGTISVRTESKGTHVSLLIKDTGSGIEPRDLPHIFDRFYKGRTHPERKGNGLGLSIVKEIIEQHGGTISAKSTLGIGTEMHITLPRA